MAAELESQSGVPRESPGVTLLLEHVAKGRWQDAAACLVDLPAMDPYVLPRAQFLLAECRLLEVMVAEVGALHPVYELGELGWRTFMEPAGPP